MGGHGQAQSVGLVAGSFHQLRGHFQLPGLPLALGIQHTAGDHQLNKIGLILLDLPHQSRRPLVAGGDEGLDTVAVYQDGQARAGLHSFRSVQQDTVNQGVFHSAHIAFDSEYQPAPHVDGNCSVF